MANSLLKKGDTLHCPECNHLVLIAQCDISYGDLMTAEKVNNAEGTIKNGDRIMCPKCLKQDLWITEPSRWNIEYPNKSLP